MSLIDFPGIVTCPCGGKIFEVHEVGVFYPEDLARCVVDEHGRMRFRPIQRSDEHGYIYLACSKCQKRFMPPAVAPVAEVVQAAAAKAVK